MAAPRVRCAALAVLLAAALGVGAAGGDDTARAPLADPDPGLLEFLGSVDGLAEVNPEYLAKTDPAHGARSSVRSGAAPAARPAGPSPPPSPNPSGVKNNE